MRKCPLSPRLTSSPPRLPAPPSSSRATTPERAKPLWLAPSTPSASTGPRWSSCPARFKQEWVMTVEPANKAVEDYLASHLKNDFIKNGTIWTRQEKHTAADTKDEISAWVAKSKGIFDKSKTVLKAAAEARQVVYLGRAALQDSLAPGQRHRQCRRRLRLRGEVVKKTIDRRNCSGGLFVSSCGQKV